ncbi:CPBP family intramembrane metalloprotease [Enterovibrio makurazakiensis]|uniref:CPBP family intramembrane glutamic endopeptidase n=1 Tax=Enterovibrio makurazakiensis TaxID=2910232 RepID=UPI003D252D1D
MSMDTTLNSRQLEKGGKTSWGKIIALTLGYLSVYVGLGYVLIYLLFTVLLDVKPLQDAFYNLPLLTALLYFTICVILSDIFFRVRGKSLYKACQFRKLDMTTTFLTIFVAVCMSIFTVTVVNLSSVKASLPELDNYMAWIMDKEAAPLFLLFALAIIVPFVEEIVFRGAVYNDVKDYSNITVAIFIQALVYAVMQFELVVGIYSFVSSVFYIMVYIWFRSLWASILIQAASLVCVISWRRFGLKDQLIAWGDQTMYLVAAVAFTLMLGSYFLLWRHYKRHYA